ncbi:hypothetical protein LMG28614_05180 [Paraburkholderia ultramafica]|uniref:Uncharacterized protein n=1 Tax=Paraburkholderia ultramafica TaxID=1544867 RepID=A0A6S7DB01_9BURK|nr:hypothetical protein [Paraburkholderia ultramafica]CAB3800459.1 hypothetical protein LMG28614_05180 [Paraburkholderia ultramafica]
MPRRTDRPAGMRARRGRKGVLTYYLVRQDGSKLVLGQNLELAYARWVQEQRSLVQLARPTTAIELLGCFEQCALPLSSEQAAARRRAELTTLRAFFTEHDDPALESIAGEELFLAWYRNDSRSSPSDTAIRMFRLVWMFALQLEIVKSNCPWKTFDLRKIQLKLEAADVVCQFASPPLKEFLEELLCKTTRTSVKPPSDVKPEYSERLQVELTLAISRAVVMLRKCGRPDLIAPVHQLKVDELLLLRNSSVLELARPPGAIFLDHQRTEVLASLRTETNASGHQTKPRTLQRFNRTASPEGDSQFPGSVGFTVEEQ